MKEDPQTKEKSSFNQIAQEIGVILSQQANLEKTATISTPYGPLKRMGRVRAQPEIPPDYRHKKHLLQGEIFNQPVVILHFSGFVYGQDPDYFLRIYQNYKEIAQTQKERFGRKITPSVLGCDDETMTLVIEKAPHDLGFYFSSTKEKEIRRVIQNALELLRFVWKRTKKQSGSYPRYVSAFLEPEYPFLKGKRIRDYLKESRVIERYLQTQKIVRAFLEELDQLFFERGFGFGDLKPDNLVEDKKGQILFIDIGKPGEYHWLSMLGQFYQATIESAPGTLFSQILKQEIRRVLESEPQPQSAIKLFALGRINRFLIGATLRNIVFTVETGQSLDENKIRSLLAKVRYLTQVSSIKEVIGYESDEFDSDWRQRLKDYPHSPEYQKNLEQLKAIIDQTLPSEKPKPKRVFLFIGIPGSGKSTLAKIIQKIYPSVILRSDWIFFEQLRDQLEEDYYQAYVYQEDLARRYLAEGYSVIMDDNNRTLKNRQEVYRWAQKLGAEPVLIVIKIDLETAAKRVSLKGKEKRSKEAILAGLRVFQSQIELPSTEERKTIKIIEIDGRLPLEQITNTLEVFFP